MSRREFLQVGKLGILAAVQQFATACNKLPLGQGSHATNESAKSLLAIGSFEQMLRLASRAPSGHNTQPWIIRVVEESVWILGIDAARRLPAVDPSSRETVLALGAFVETLIVAARHFGSEVSYEVLTSSCANNEILRLTLHRSQPVSQLLEQIQRRRTLRNGYRKVNIGAADLASTMGPGEDFQYFPNGTSQAGYLADATIEANQKQVWRENAESELAYWIRWSSSDAERYRNGLTPASMEIDGISGWYVRHFYSRGSVMSESFRKTSVQQTIQRVREGGGWLVLSSASEDIARLVETGRTLQRMWLQLRKKGIAIHPMTQVLEEAPWQKQVGTHLSLGGIPQFVLRIGYVDSYPEPISLRMPPAWFIV